MLETDLKSKKFQKCIQQVLCTKILCLPHSWNKTADVLNARDSDSYQLH